MKNDPQFLTEILIEYLQPVGRSLKQTVLETSPYSTVGGAPSNQPEVITMELKITIRYGLR